MKDKPSHLGPTHPRLTILAVAFALISYIALAIYGAMLDRHTTLQSNRWRDEIVRLASGAAISKDRLQFTEYQPFWAYLSAFIIVIVAFASIVFIAMQLLT